MGSEHDRDFEETWNWFRKKGYMLSDKEGCLESRRSLEKLLKIINNDEARKWGSIIGLWPYYGLIELAERTTRKKLSQDEKNKIRSLKSKIEKSQEGYPPKELREMFFGEYSPIKAKILKPDTIEINELEQAVDEAGKCFINKRRFEDIILEWVNDIIIGGHIIVYARDPSKESNSTRKDMAYFMRLIPTMNYSGERVLFIDTIESGDYTFKHPEQWIEQKRGNHLGHAISSAVLIANKLGISKVTFGEWEARRIAKMIGLPSERLYLFKGGERKHGAQGNQDNRAKNTLWTHTMFREGERTFYTLTFNPGYVNEGFMVESAKNHLHTVIEGNRNRTRRLVQGTVERYEVAVAILRALEANNNYSKSCEERVRALIGATHEVLRANPRWRELQRCDYD